MPKFIKKLDLVVCDLLKSIRDHGNYDIIRDKYSTIQLEDAIKYAVNRDLITGLTIIGRNELGELHVDSTADVRNTRKGLNFIEDFSE
ncbi:MAG: hypothetical protein M0P14_03610 [Alkaliphilus sp.]|nr:hypothetical protein [Alkaliphilus sp.]